MLNEVVGLVPYFTAQITFNYCNMTFLTKVYHVLLKEAKLH